MLETDSLEGCSILLTGGTGFFGRALLQRLSTIRSTVFPPFSCCVVTRSPERFLELHPQFSGHEWLRFHRGNIADPESLPFHDRFSHVIHAAADSSTSQIPSPLDRFDQIASGTRNILDLSLHVGAKRFLLTSSGAVYGSQPSNLERIPEDWHGAPDPMRVGDVYGIAKIAAEHLCTLYADAFGLECIVTRCFAFVGPDLPLNVHFAIGNFIRDALWGKQIVVHGDGSPVRSYMHQNDLAWWLIELLFRGTAGHAYNVGSDQAISIRELAFMVRDILAPGMAVRFKRSPNGITGRNRYVPDIGKARSTIGLVLEYSLEEAIRSTAEALLKTDQQPL